MNRLRHLFTTAMAGFSDMAPALRAAFNNRDDDDRLEEVFGSPPRPWLLLLTAAAISSGYLANQLAEDSGPPALIHWPIFTVAIALALPLRRYLFRSGAAQVQDFPWLAAALAPGAALLALLGLGSAVAGGAVVPVDDGPVWTTLANLLVVVADALSYAALATLAAAALCYSRNWFKALVDLIWIVLLLKFVLWFVEYVLLEIGIMERVLAILVESILGFDLPDWLGELSDRISYGLLLLGINLAVIGATWTTSRQSFGQLLATGSVDIVKAVREVVDPPDPKAVAKREQKAARKAEKRQQKTERAEQKAAQKAARKASRQQRDS